MRDAFPIVCAIGDKLRLAEANGRHGWRDCKALIVLVAQAGDWNGASCMADALGVGPDAQQAIYEEVYGHPMPDHFQPPPAAAAANVTPIRRERPTA